MRQFVGSLLARLPIMNAPPWIARYTASIVSGTKSRSAISPPSGPGMVRSVASATSGCPNTPPGSIIDRTWASRSPSRSRFSANSRDRAAVIGVGGAHLVDEGVELGIDHRHRARIPHTADQGAGDLT